MVQQVSNSNLLIDFETLLGSEYTKIDFKITIHSNAYFSGGAYMQTSSFTEADLYLKFYIDQMVLSQDPPIDVFSIIEHKITDMIYFAGGDYYQRQAEPFRDKHPMLLSYTLKLPDYEGFLQKVHQLALKKIDQEFTKALESKLLED